MARKTQKLTVLQQEYKHQQNRIKNILKRGEKRGFITDTYQIPTMPKRVTKRAIERLKEVKPINVYSNIEFLIPTTGEIVKGRTGLRIEKQTKKDIRQFKKHNKQQPITSNTMDFVGWTDNIIDQVKSYYLGFPPIIATKLIAWLNTLIAQQGQQDVATMLEKSPEKFHEYLARSAFDSEGAIQDYCTAMMNYLPYASDNFKRDIMEDFNNEELGFYEE
jgi:ribosomal protein L24